MNIKQLELELTWAADEFLIEEFALELEIPIRISRRMSKTFGSFAFTRSRKTGKQDAKEIVISANLIEHHPWEDVIDTLKHECVHYALFELGKPYRDGDAYFENTLRAHGISSTQTTEYRGFVQVYECKKCSTQYKRHMKGFEKRYGCGECDGFLKHVGTEKI